MTKRKRKTRNLTFKVSLENEHERLLLCLLALPYFLHNGETTLVEAFDGLGVGSGLQDGLEHSLRLPLVFPRGFLCRM